MMPTDNPTIYISTKVPSQKENHIDNMNFGDGEKNWWAFDCVDFYIEIGEASFFWVPMIILFILHVSFVNNTLTNSKRKCKA